MNLAETASGLLNQAFMLRVTKRPLDALVAYDELVRRHRSDQAAEILEYVAKALYNKATALEGLGRDREAFAAYQDAAGFLDRILLVLERQLEEAIHAGDGLRANLLRATRHIRPRLRAYVHFNLGLMLDEGRGAPENPAEAGTNYRLAAAEGHAMAQCKLGFMYGTGRGVAQDHREALMWFGLAADGDEHAPREDFPGRPSPHDYGTPLRTRRGDSNAQYNLGVMYARGLGGPRNPAQAAKWFRRAAAQDYPNAQAACEAVMEEAGMTPERPAPGQSS